MLNWQFLVLALLWVNQELLKLRRRVMADTMTSRGSIPEIIRNDADLYLGDLKHYFNVVFHKSQNCYCPYHNFRHMLHVLWLCYNACLHYKDRLTSREMRNLLVAALFHDFNHSGAMGDDDLNIERAIRALRQNILTENGDKEEVENIIEIMRATEYPYTVASDGLPLYCRIIRDADLSQALNPAWIQQVIFGLAKEWRIEPIKVLRKQAEFLGQLDFCTQWGRKTFPQSVLDEKIEESNALLELLDDPVFV